MSGGHRGIGLEMALTFIEAGARAVYCVDLPKEPSEEWQTVRDYAARLSNKGGEGRLEYVNADVTDQVRVSTPLSSNCQGNDELMTRDRLRCGRSGKT